ncbi:hypothetical protein NPIL_281781 [Nephila pilipes]|uniref:Uncharacterized protein n=1 Tax=Nephila pilipes TaxID=299642 RepID=A0A8X6N4P6_NEPPI|nr:hypothetical protein NPIL_249161 [Nephila pilipes]GFU37748.1 hypothetical protein NPIL_281781 [Nephila pilipes]
MLFQSFSFDGYGISQILKYFAKLPNQKVGKFCEVLNEEMRIPHPHQREDFDHRGLYVIQSQLDRFTNTLAQTLILAIFGFVGGRGGRRTLLVNDVIPRNIA